MYITDEEFRCDFCNKIYSFKNRGMNIDEGTPQVICDECFDKIFNFLNNNNLLVWEVKDCLDSIKHYTGD